MKHTLCKAMSVTAVVTLLVLPGSLSAATGEVTKSGSTYTAKVDGSTKYTGTVFNSAISGCINNMSSGWIRVRTGGSSVSGYGPQTKSGVNFNFYGNTVNASGATSILQISNDNGVEVQNMKSTRSGNSGYGLWVQTTDNYTQIGCSHNGNGLTYRLDSNKGGWCHTLNVNNTTTIGAGAHGMETLGVDGFKYGTITADNSNGCGLLLNTTNNSSGSTVDAYNCCYTGGYAGFRNANDNGKGTLGYASSDHCGRGFFSVSGSNNMTVSNCLLQNCRDMGIWLQSTHHTRVNAGTVRNNSGGCWYISSDLGNNSINVTCSNNG